MPDFGRVVAQMQYDMYHVYTVDEHTLFAIGILHQIETGQLKEELPVASAIMPTVDRRAARCMSRPCCTTSPRDAAATIRSSARRSRSSLGRASDLSAEETETVAWLVRWHLLMSNTAFKRDIGDPQTIQNFRRARAVP